MTKKVAALAAAVNVDHVAGQWVRTSGSVVRKGG
jgi:hypothetical protein